MGATYKNNIELTIFGESHGKAIGITIGNLPSGIQIDLDEVSRDMKRRAPGQNKMSTARKETDQVEILSGLQDGITTGAPLTGVIYNSDQHSKDYSLLKTNMRPGHSDYPAYIKYKGFNDVRGGGHFSGRITAPIVFAGNIAKQILKQKGIIVGAHILSIGKIKDEKFPVNVDDEMLLKLSEKQYPTIKEGVFEKMEETILKAKENLDSVGGKVECVALHVPAGVGEPFFDSLESHLSSLMFSIPAVKSVSFGDGESIDEMLGSEANDCYYYDEEGNVRTSTNHNGGITGGITNGMPVSCTVTFKPTPSIAKKQKTINIETKENVELKIKGRHDPCIVQRAVVVVEAMMASKSYQSDLLPLELDKNIKTEFKKDPLVGYQGIAGAFSQSAVENFFGEGTRNIGYKDFEDVYVALENGEIDYGVLPIENSLTGSINDNYDLIRKYGFYIVGETAVNVSQCLMALPGTKIEDIRQVYSHPQGLAQSSEFLYQHRYIEQRPFQDTAMAAKYVMDSKDPTKAAIASPLACKLYGLEMLKENVQNKKNNRTRFMVI